MIIKIDPKIIHFNRRVFEYCTIPYPGHKGGCPNYNKKTDCPPNQLLIDRVLDFKKDIYLISTSFDLYNHLLRMKRKHLNWSLRQLKCLLYWQSRARKIQSQEVYKTMREYGLHKIVFNPEKHGVQVFDTMRELGIALEKNPMWTVWLVSLAGFHK